MEFILDQKIIFLLGLLSLSGLAITTKKCNISHFIFKCYTCFANTRYRITKYTNKFKHHQEHQDWEVLFIKIRENTITNHMKICFSDTKLLKDIKSTICALFHCKSYINTNSGETNTTVIEVFYNYNGKIFILPIYELDQITEKFPPYTEESGFRFKQGYIEIKTDHYDHKMDKHFNTAVSKYIGPFGDFYKGTDFYVKTDEMFLENGEPLLKTKSDSLKLTNDLEEAFQIQHGEPVIMKSMFD